jgi:hypothetical protein
MKVVIATGTIARFLKRINKIAMATFWGTVYVLPGYSDDKLLLLHEEGHLLQMKRLGKLGYFTEYLKELIKYGYKDAPLEKNATQEAIDERNKNVK